MLGYYGYSSDVAVFMQKASNKTRAYYINANGFKGFVVISIVTILRRADTNSELAEVTKHQELDLQDLLGKLEGMQSNMERIDYLSQWCPSLCIFVLQKCGMT